MHVSTSATSRLLAAVQSGTGDRQKGILGYAHAAVLGMRGSTFVAMDELEGFNHIGLCVVSALTIA
eukprot:695175-Prorocentrum_lima.AAC.1